ncbi:MAG: hypothetical protein F4Y45_02480 [Acidobacteria bacterium]|nr:hypothetical protein [Acidobacteriota bacterium]MYJ03962.1 hypothetical protein [Acidobacteriota bacterium]
MTAGRALALAVCLALTACGAAEESARGAQEAPSPTELSPQPPAVAASPGAEGDVARFQRLSVEALRLMIAAAQRELPIGPIQDRINAARRVVATDAADAADQLDEVVADLKAMLEAAPN